MNDEINELDPNLIVLSSRGATYLNKRSAVILDLGDRGTLIEPDPFQQGIQNLTCFCSKRNQVNTNYGDYCGFCGGERREEWTGYPAEYPEFKPSKQCKTEVTESSLPLKLELLLPQPDDTTCCQLNSIAIAQERAKKFLDKTIYRLDSCGHGPKTEEELDAFEEKYQLVMSFLPLMYEYVTNDQGDSGWLDENGSIRLRPMGSGPEWNEPGTYQIRYPHGVKEG